MAAKTSKKDRIANILLESPASLDTIRHIATHAQAPWSNMPMSEFVSDELINVVKSLNSSVGKLKTVKDGLDSSLKSASTQIVRAEEFLTASISDLIQGKPFDNHISALNEAQNCVKNRILSDPNEHHISIRILAVSSSFSWHFVTRFLPDILRANSELNCSIDMLLVNPDHLRNVNAGLNSEHESWADLSESRIEKIERVVHALDDDIRSRYRFELGYYDNLPYWHGILINGMELLLGRTSWQEDKDDKGTFHLRVGENTYRKFQSKGPRGKERIDLFTNWFDYYRTLRDSTYKNF